MSETNTALGFPDAPGKASGDLHQRIENEGWASVTVPDEADLRVLARLLRPQLNSSAIVIERVSPKRSDQAPPGTLSASYGLGAFPVHTERAHWEHPPRYVVFRSVGQPTDRPTTLLDSYLLKDRPDLVQRLYAIPWNVRWNDTKFEAPVLSPLAYGRWRVRYDGCCMTPSQSAHNDLQIELDEQLRRLPIEQHHWSSGVALVVDNWRTLHGRGTSDRIDHDRVLERIVIP